MHQRNSLPARRPRSRRPGILIKPGRRARGARLLLPLALLLAAAAFGFAPALAPSGFLRGEDPPASGSNSAKLAGEILSRLDEMPLASLWDSVARLESLGKDALPAIRAAAGAGGEHTKLGAAKVLLAIGEEKMREDALRSIAELARSSRDREVRAIAIELLGSEDPEHASEPLRQILEASPDDPEVAIPAARVLWDLDQDPQARKRLLEFLRSRDRKVRFPAALALAETHCFEGEVKEALRELRQEPTARGRLAGILLQLDRMSRQEEQELRQDGVVLPGVDPKKLLREKDTRIRELEAKIEGLGRSRGVSTSDPFLDEVLAKIQENYVDDARVAKRTELILAAVKGLVRSLDDFSSFFDVKETARFMNDIKGEYFGIGLQVAKLSEDGPLEVMRPIYGGGAYQQGIRTGDRILEVSGVSTEDLSQEEIVERHLKGPEGTEVKLKVMRRGWMEPREFSVPRRIIEVPSVFDELLPGKIGYLRLTNFGEKSAEEFEGALDRLEGAKMEGLVVDLRNNPGGLLTAAVRIVDLFVGERPEPIVSQKGRGETESTYPTRGERPNYPLVILINGRSASASEVVSGALKDYHRAVLVGQKSFGKGSVQRLLPLSDRVKELLGGETRLRLTVQYYYLPSGRCIHSQYDENGHVIPGTGGVEPDVTVEPEKYPGWLAEEVERIRSSPRINEYLDRHLDALRKIGLEGDGRDLALWPEFEALYKSFDTRASRDHVRQVLRFHLRRRLEDERAKEFPSDLEEDLQLQAGVLEILTRLGVDPATIPAYAGLKKSPPATPPAPASSEKPKKD